MIAFLGLLIWTGYALITNATRRPPAARSTPRSTSGCEARLHLAGLLAAEPHATAARRLELEREAARLTRQTAPYTDVTVSFSKSISVLHASIRENARQARQAGDEDRAAWWDAREQEAARDQTQPGCPPARSTRSPPGAAAHQPPQPANGAAAARAQRRALAIPPPQRLPVRRRRIPRHHPRDDHPRPGRASSPTPRTRSPSSSRNPAPPASPAPCACSSTRSTRPRPACPATPGPSPTS